jgi:2-oxoglutarate ferredoxin oxidoreductase subunit delta
MSNDPTTPRVGGEKADQPRPGKSRGQVRVIRDRCKGCGYCVAFCPTESLTMSPEFNVKGYHFPRLESGRDCTGCDLCGMFCPDFAIHGTRNAHKEANSRSRE